MIWLWSWKGKCIGYRDDEDNLWTYNGHHVGSFIGSVVYDKKGKYLGEIISNDRLITLKSSKILKSNSFTPYAKHSGYAKYANYAGYAMYAGYEEFPSVEELINIK